MRKVLKNILYWLSNWAIQKHHIELVVITGNIGAEIAKEAMYFVLSEKFLVRRNVKPVWWDLSIPLNILGYEDKQRNLLDWLILITKSTLFLIFGQKSEHTLIFSIQTENDSTINYWSKIIKPHFLLVLDETDVESKLVAELVRIVENNKGIIVYKELNRKKVNGLKYGKDSNAKVSYKVTKSSYLITYKKYRLKFSRNYILPPLKGDFLCGIIALAIAKGMKIDDISNGLLKYDMRNTVFNKISQQLHG